MAAFRALNFGLGLDRGSGVEFARGFDFCASCSGKLTWDICSADLVPSASYDPVCFGGLVSFNRGIAEAIEVSGTPAFLGGGGGGSREYG